MDLATIKKLTEKIQKQNGGRRPVPQELHRAILREAKRFYENNRGTATMDEFIAKVSQPGFEPSVFDMYVLKEMMNFDD